MRGGADGACVQTRADERESVGAQVEPAYLPRRPSPPLPSFSPSSLSSSPSPPFLLNPSLQAPPLNTPPLSALLSRPSPLLCPLSSPPLLSHGRSQADILALHPNSGPRHAVSQCATGATECTAGEVRLEQTARSLPLPRAPGRALFPSPCFKFKFKLDSVHHHADASSTLLACAPRPGTPCPPSRSAPSQSMSEPALK
eukprot:300499-Rhodomonas_salina.3